MWGGRDLMKIPAHIPICIILSLFFLSSVQADGLTNLAGQVARLNISRNSYTLGKPLTAEQKEMALKHTVRNNTPGTYKFQDGNLFVVIHKKTDRVLIMYEQYEPASVAQIQRLIGSLVVDFGEPTVMVHDKILYWAYSDKEKLTEQAYRETKDAGVKLPFWATVKVSSSTPIMADGATSKAGSVYYIISSSKVLEIMKASN